MKKKRICLTIPEADGQRLDEVATELGVNRTRALRLLITSWKPWELEDVRQQINRLNNLTVLLTSIISGYVKDAQGNETYYRLKNEAEKTLKTYKETGKLLI